MQDHSLSVPLEGLPGQGAERNTGHGQQHVGNPSCRDESTGDMRPSACCWGATAGLARFLQNDLRNILAGSSCLEMVAVRLDILASGRCWPDHCPGSGCNGDGHDQLQCLARQRALSVFLRRRLLFEGQPLKGNLARPGRSTTSEVDVQNVNVDLPHREDSVAKNKCTYVYMVWAGPLES